MALVFGDRFFEMLQDLPFLTTEKS